MNGWERLPLRTPLEAEAPSAAHLPTCTPTTLCAQVLVIASTEEGREALRAELEYKSVPVRAIS